MSEETKSVAEQKFRANTSNLWEKNAEDYQRLELRISSLEVKLDRLREDLTKCSEELKAKRTKKEGDQDKTLPQMKVNLEKASGEMKAHREKLQEKDEKSRVELNKNIGKIVEGIEKRTEEIDTRFWAFMREIKVDSTREMQEIEDRSEKLRKLDQISAWCFAGFLFLLGVAIVGAFKVVSVLVALHY